MSPLTSTSPSIMSSTQIPYSPASAYSPVISLNSTDDLPPSTAASPNLSSPPTPLRPARRDSPSSRPASPRSINPPSRSSSLRRKPVPEYHTMPVLAQPASEIRQPIPLPNAALPPTHPFASKDSRSIHSGTSSPLSPGTVKMEDDIFFSPPGRGVRSGPLPPRRTFSPVGSINSTGSVRGVKGAQNMSKDGSLANSKSPSLSSLRAEMLDGEDKTPKMSPVVMGPDGDEIEEVTMPPTTGEAINIDLNRPLPPLPLETTARQNSSDSGHSPLPLTPRTASLSTAPQTHPGAGQSTGTATLPSSPLVGTITKSRPTSSGSGKTHAFGKRKDLLRSHESYSTNLKAQSATPEELSDEEFSVDRIPSKRRLVEAGTLFLRDEDGHLVPFSSFFPTLQSPPSATDSLPPTQPPTPTPKTVFFFIRHFWCGQCQDFTFASLSLLDPIQLAQANIRVVVISNGSWKIIKSYKKLFNCPFPIYVDGPRKLYQLLGMTKLTNDFGPLFKGRAAYHQRSAPSQLIHGVGNALFKMPLADPGKLTQLGGEFIISPGYICELAHRMTNTSNHMEAPDVIRLAGVSAPTKSDMIEFKFEESQTAELERLQKEEVEWRRGRETELERIRRRKAERRGEIYKAPSNASAIGLGLEDELGYDGAEAGGNDEIDERFKRVMAMQGGQEGASRGLALGQLA